ncbi:MacS family sensor histidine kinase [Amycolatopsis suaedae]|uniref:ATP-binding protein n=1 Tax=Amycolatopsis suaedae TaxID=2510978 RepID=A0A4Q7JCL1_9PSEU|nr:DUF5931 domain-containing protein [Amycolatopsis suaedae]RZQ65047.1 ATP-binding protein [Amycolatopsis suaedae]
MSTRFGPTPRDLATPLWWATIGLRVVTLIYALVVAVVHHEDYRRQWLAWIVLGIMTAWTIATSLVYSRERPRWRRRGVVYADVLITAALVVASHWVLTREQISAGAPLVTTVWAAVAPLAGGMRFGASGGVISAAVIAIATGLSRQEFTLDLARDGFLLLISGLLVGLTATVARRSGARLAQALRAEAATAERERLARSIHDNVLQVLARVRKRGTELGGEATELAELAGEQEIALRALVTSEPAGSAAGETADLRGALQLLATSRVQVSAPAGEVNLPAATTAELVAAVREALSNVDKHAGRDARAWVLLEDLSDEVVITVRDDGPGIPEGRLEQARAQGHLGVDQSIRGRVTGLGGTITLDTGPRSGTEWELRVPKGRPRR